MAQRPVLPLGSGLGQIKAPSLQVNANDQDRGVYGQSPERTREAAINRLENLFRGGGFLRPENQRGKSVIADLISNDPSIGELDIFSPDAVAGIAGQRMPLTGGGDQPGDATFGGRIPEDTDDDGDVTIEMRPTIDDEGDVTTGTVGPRLEDADAADTGIRTRSEDLDAAVAKGQTGQPKTDPEDPFAAALADAMKSYEDAKSGENTEKKDINYYKQQFADATGIDVSGKVDKSQALMAFGLALMQNKAGKGFDVGRILGEVGAAGEKAMPELSKARSEARAAQLAGGKFALEQVASDKATELANQQAALDRINELRTAQLDNRAKERIEQIKGFEERKTARLQTELDMLKDGMAGAEYGKNYKLPFATGQVKGSFDIIMAYDETRPNQPVIVGADPMIRKYIDGRGGIDDALELMDVMENAARDIADGGGTAKMAFDQLNSVAKAIFPDLNTGKPTSQKEYEQSVKIIMGRFKRFLTQETGNGISNVDVRTWEEEILKKPTWFTNLDETLNALDLLRDTFNQKRLEFDQGLDHLYDPKNHVDPSDVNGFIEKYGSLEQIKGTEGRLVFQDGKIVRTK